MLITIVINSLMLSLCNIYAPNNQAEQLEFLQEPKQYTDCKDGDDGSKARLFGSNAVAKGWLRLFSSALASL